MTSGFSDLNIFQPEGFQVYKVFKQKMCDLHIGAGTPNPLTPLMGPQRLRPQDTVCFSAAIAVAAAVQLSAVKYLEGPNSAYITATIPECWIWIHTENS